MAVCSYYCASCGVKLRFEEARHGRTDLRANAFYCPSCVVDHEIPVLEPPPSGEDPLVLRRLRGSRVGPIDLGSGERDRVSQRIAPARGARSRRSARLRPSREAQTRPGRRAWLGGVLVGFALAGVVAFGLIEYSRRVGATVRGEAAVAQPATEREVPAAGHGAPLLSQPPAEAGPAHVLPAPAAFVASRRSGKVHRSDCRYAKKIASDNRIPVRSLEQARARGFEPCRVCLGAEAHERDR
ncbi:MAG: hypothetical protein D6776_02200 [Planctomycetota bacterium]|nr:MAG: hypothetical protein D6776_02200 [Planctomycetota bacterium]